MWRKATFSAQSKFSRCQRVAAPLAFVFGTVVSIRPVCSLMESASKSPPVEEPEQTQKRSLHYLGRSYLPHDIYYNAPVKDALATLRSQKRDQISGDLGVTDAPNEGVKEDTKALKDCGRKDLGTLTLIGYKGGPLHSQVNQDRAICIEPYHIQESTAPKRRRMWTYPKAPVPHPSQNVFLGVFDGHAQWGERVSEFAVNELPKLLAEKLRDLEGTTEQVARALIDTFVEIDKKAPADVSGGCTASVVLKYGDKVYFANAGDSRSFLVVYRKNVGTTEIVYITREDKPHLEDERKRVESMGGKVYIPMAGTSRVLYTDPISRVQSGLAMSRSIGDWTVGKLGVIPDPLVHVVDIPKLVTQQLKEGGDDDVYIFAVSATDGITDYATPSVVAEAVALSLYGEDGPHLLSALEQLIYFAAKGWEQSKQGRYRDDMSIAVAQLRIPSEKAMQ
eukprot:Nitzschia sp. Nitz4//scaffold116_size91068//26371//27717//NITZ4_004951-RA/size91068-processed-gene-0.23-mRNA-1//1//CDS//3329533557//7418//frame0